MQQEKLLERLRYSLRKNDVTLLAGLFSELPGGTALLFSLCESPDKQLAFHASWVLEFLIKDDTDSLRANAYQLTRCYIRLKNPSVIRHLGKLVAEWMSLERKSGYPETVSNICNIDNLSEVAFDRVVGVDTPVAVRANGLDILWECSFYRLWVLDEIPNLIRLLRADASPGILARCRQVEQKLRLYGSD